MCLTDVLRIAILMIYIRILFSQTLLFLVNKNGGCSSDMFVDLRVSRWGLELDTISWSPQHVFMMKVKMVPYTTGENTWPSFKPLLKASEDTSIFIFIFTSNNQRRFRGQLILAFERHVNCKESRMPSRCQWKQYIVVVFILCCLVVVRDKKRFI